MKSIAWAIVFVGMLAVDVCYTHILGVRYEGYQLVGVLTFFVFVMLCVASLT